MFHIKYIVNHTVNKKGKDTNGTEPGTLVLLFSVLHHWATEYNLGTYIHIYVSIKKCLNEARKKNGKSTNLFILPPMISCSGLP